MNTGSPVYRLIIDRPMHSSIWVSENRCTCPKIRPGPAQLQNIVCLFLIPEAPSKMKVGALRHPGF